MKLIKIILPFFLLVCLISCKSDDDSTPPINNQNNTDFSDNFGNEISRTFLGNIIDVNNNPIEGAQISIGNANASTDSNGIFIINNAIVHERFGYVIAKKTGYLHGSRAVVPSSGTNKVTIMLLEEIVAGTTSSGTAETISITNGASVALEGNYVKPNGSVYAGNVDVIIHHLDPVDENMPNQMPGMLYAADAQNEERMLQTFGMLAIELRGDAGEDLNLAEGSSSEIRMPVDASLIANAPSTIPLWYFDETNGYWIEDGVATLIGNEYVGTVSHFSFWNCDIPTDAVTLCVTVSDANTNLLANMYVTISSSTFGTRGGYTNDNGEVCGFVPSNESLEINVYSWDACGENPLYNATIGPFTSDDSIAITILNSIDIISETVVGIFNTCEDTPVTNGYVGLSYANQSFFDIVTDGTFEINLMRCENDNTFSIQGSDYVNLQVTDSINYTFTTPLTDLGTLNACNAVTEFIQYNIDDGAIESLIMDSIQASYGPQGTLVNFNISGQGGSTGADCFYMQGVLPDPPTVGTYDNLDWNDQNDTGFNIIECIDMSSTNNNIMYNLTAFGDVDEYIDINFSGDYEDNQGNPHTISGVVHVLRDN